MRRLGVIALLLSALHGPAWAGGAAAEHDAASAPSTVAPSHDAAHAGSADAASSAGRTARIHDRSVFVVSAARGKRSAEERAAAATTALERAASSEQAPEVRVVPEGETYVVFVGAAPLIQVDADDAAAAGDASAQVHASAIAAKVQVALTEERRRSRAAQTVFSFSLLVFSGLIALLVLRRLSEIAGRAEIWIRRHPEKLPALHVRGVEMVRPAALQGASSVALGVARVLAQIGVAYLWLLFSLSLFEVTSGYSERLTGFVLAPLSALMGRLAGALPLLVLAAMVAFAVLLLVRFAGLFFGSVARGETALAGLPPELAVATGVVVRIGIVLAALVLAAPLVTGIEDGAVARVGWVALVALGAATTPLLASSAIGLWVVYGRRLAVGDWVELGDRKGRVRELGLIDVRLLDADGCELRVPHLLALVHPMRTAGKKPVVELELDVEPSADLERVRALVLAAAEGLGSSARIELLACDEGGAHHRATMVSDATEARSRWLAAIATSFAASSIRFGRARPERPT